ncbi:MAG: protein kinase [Pirellulaceae bacterium]|nr:protein kinase [Pirellulaceae bacterium]
MSHSITVDLEPLFEAARQLEPGVRDDFVQRHVPEELRELLADVLASHGAVSTQLWTPGERASCEIPTGTEIDDFVVCSRIDAGGMGTVYRAYEQQLRRFVALKLLRHQDRSSREAEIMAQLRHPNIVPIYRVGAWEGQTYLTTELIERGDNRTNLQRFLDEGDFAERTAVELMIPICEAAHAAHQLGIVHRDIKPANILVTAEGTPKLTDFSLADGDGEARRCGGTPGYMAPEQLSSERPSPAMDVYGIGATLGALVLRHPPRGAADFRQPGLSVSRDLETIILKCLRTDPQARYATAAELADDLRRLLNHEPIRARRASRWEVVGKWCRRKPWVAGFLALAAVSFFVLVIGGSLSYARILRERERAVGFRDNALGSVRNLLDLRFELLDLPENRAAQTFLRQRTEEALKYLEMYADDQPSEATLQTEAIARHFLGDALFEEGNVPGAISQYERAIAAETKLTRLLPDSLLAWTTLGGSHEALGVMHREAERPELATKAYDAAIPAYRRALELDPDDPRLPRHIARLQSWRAALAGADDPARKPAELLRLTLHEANRLSRAHEYDQAADKFEAAIALLDQASMTDQERDGQQAYYQEVVTAHRLARQAIADDSVIASQQPAVAQLLWYYRAVHAADNGDLLGFRAACEQLDRLPGPFAPYYVACAHGAMIQQLYEVRAELRDQGLARFAQFVEATGPVDVDSISNDPDLQAFRLDPRFTELLRKLQSARQ